MPLVKSAEPLLRDLDQPLLVRSRGIRMVRLKNNFLVALAFLPHPEQLLVQEAIVGRNDIVARPVDKQDVSAEFDRLLERLVPRQGVEIFGLERITEIIGLPRLDRFIVFVPADDFDDIVKRIRDRGPQYERFDTLVSSGRQHRNGTAQAVADQRHPCRVDVLDIEPIVQNGPGLLDHRVKAKLAVFAGAFAAAAVVEAQHHVAFRRQRPRRLQEQPVDADPIADESVANHDERHARAAFADGSLISYRVMDRTDQIQRFMTYSDMAFHSSSTPLF